MRDPERWAPPDFTLASIQGTLQRSASTRQWDWTGWFLQARPSRTTSYGLEHVIFNEMDKPSRLVLCRTQLQPILPANPAATVTQTWTLSALRALPDSGHSFIGSRSACSGAEITKFGTFPLIATPIGDDRFWRNRSFMERLKPLLRRPGPAPFADCPLSKRSFPLQTPAEVLKRADIIVSPVENSAQCLVIDL